MARADDDYDDDFEEDGQEEAPKKYPYASEYMQSEGNLTQDPKDISKNPDRSIAVFHIACGWRDSLGNEGTEFRNVKVTDKFLAQRCLESLRKGNRVCVDGTLEKVREYETNDGTLRREITILADRVAPSMRFTSWRPVDAKQESTSRSSRQSDSSRESAEERRPRRRRRSDDDPPVRKRRSDSEESSGRGVANYGDDDDDDWGDD